MHIPEGTPLNFIDAKNPKNPGDVYVYGLRAIMDKRGLNVDEAAEVCKQDFLDTQGYEHLTALHNAVKYVKWEDSQKKK